MANLRGVAEVLKDFGLWVATLLGGSLLIGAMVHKNWVTVLLSMCAVVLGFALLLAMFAIGGALTSGRSRARRAIGWILLSISIASGLGIAWHFAPVDGPDCPAGPRYC